MNTTNNGQQAPTLSSSPIAPPPRPRVSPPHTPAAPAQAASSLAIASTKDRVLHPAIVEAASFYTNVLEENERLKSELRTMHSDIDSMQRALNMWRQQAETERALKEGYLRDRHAQNAELDVIVRTVIAARDRATQRG